MRAHSGPSLARRQRGPSSPAEARIGARSRSMPSWTRRVFLQRSAAAALAAPLGRLMPGAPVGALGKSSAGPVAWQRESSVGAALRAGQQLPIFERRPPNALGLPGPDPRAARLQRFSDLRRHFAFEYYPWY